MDLALITAVLKTPESLTQTCRRLLLKSRDIRHGVSLGSRAMSHCMHSMRNQAFPLTHEHPLTFLTRRSMGDAASSHLGRPVPLEPLEQTKLIDSLLAAPWPAANAASSGAEGAATASAGSNGEASASSAGAADGANTSSGGSNGASVSPVLAAGVPGAGGYDAIFAICRGRHSIDGLFFGAAPASVSPCLCSCGPAMGSPGAGVRLFSALRHI